MARLISDDVLLAVTVWMEARGESQDGKVAVAEVILRRAAHRYQSDGTVADAILRAYQFSGWNSAAPGRALAVQLDDADSCVADCIAAVETARGESNLSCGAVIYFNAATAGSVFVQHIRDVCDHVVTIGHHEFYRERVRPG
jgi:spore germination cell wall hydrolase CwlJ-like protein